ncbi:MAG: hypothetical protein ACKVS9_11040 [Phycisphaerae bacterium]
MAKRLAVFVEGQTEQIFMQRMLVEVAGRHKITIDVVQARGSGPPRAVTLQGHSASNTPYYALICDCGADNRVASDMRDNYDGLVAAGYCLVLGLRDIHPEPDNKIPLIRTAVSRVLPNGVVPARLVLAIREIEAWFIVEDGHYPAIHPELSAALIKQQLGLDTATVSAESIACPADTLHAAYQLKGRAYRKNRDCVERTVHALDYARLYVDLSQRVPALGELCAHVNGFVA